MAATAVSAYVASAGVRRAMLVSTLVYTLGCAICAAAADDAGTACRTHGARVSAAVRSSRWSFIAQDHFFPNRLVPRIVACLSLVWTALGPERAAHRRRVRHRRPVALRLLVIRVCRASCSRQLVHPLLARAGSDSALPGAATSRSRG